jgi:predicted DNA-binding transcriptional regulator AlpA
LQRNITGPDKDWLTLGEAATYMGLSEGTLKLMVTAGKFPKGAKISSRIQMWNWMDVVAFMHLASRTPDDEEMEEEVETSRKAK